MDASGRTPDGPSAVPPAGGEITLRAPAKINLTLEVLRPRADGYHDLASVMQAIDLTDEVVVRLSPGNGIALGVHGAPVPAGPENLVWQAAHAWLEAARAEGGGGSTAASLRAEIELHKRIPAGAGLGGGSADAAAVLLALNRLGGHPLGASDLYRLAAGVGSDVPFFLAGGTCLATGRGEKLRRLPPLPPLWVVVVAPEVPVATRWAFAARSRQELTATGNSSSMLELAIRKRSLALIGRHLVNDLEPVVAPRYREVAEVLEELRGAGTIGAGMSGSGSSTFALVEDHARALRVARAMRRFNHPVHVCRPFRGGPMSSAAGRLPESAPRR